jgi:hypothetical protein
MARTRLLKPGFFSNDLLAECEPLARLLFAGLWTLVDRDGRMECRHTKIKAQLLPYDNCDVSSLMEQLAARGFVQVYAVDGRAFVQVNGFAKHQNPHPKETSEGLPGPPQNTGETQSHGNSMTSHGESAAGHGNTGTSRAFSLLPSPHSLNRSPFKDTHTHAGDEFTKPGWAAEAWSEFVAQWNATERAAKWTPLMAPTGWVDLAASPGWLDRARQAMARLPGCKFFETPLAVTKFFEFVDRILAGEFDNPQRKYGRPAPGSDDSERKAALERKASEFSKLRPAPYRSPKEVAALAAAVKLTDDDL